MFLRSYTRKGVVPGYTTHLSPSPLLFLCMRQSEIPAELRLNAGDDGNLATVEVNAVAEDRQRARQQKSFMTAIF
jgi:hypothetical protein